MTAPSEEAQGILRARPHSSPRPSRVAGLSSLGLGGARDGALLVPDAAAPSRSMPLVLALHGAGGIASQLVDLLAEPAARHGIAILAPESRASTWDMIRGGYGPDTWFIDRALRAVFDRYAVDPERMAVAGFSDGASYALSLGLINGDLFTDVLAFSPGFMAPTRQTGSPRIFVSHGTQDSVLPIARCSRRLVPALEQSGYDVTYVEFEGGHVVPDDVVEQALDLFLH